MSPKIVCYYSSWAAYRNGEGNFEVSNIDVSLCTHLIYAFAGLSSNGTIISLNPDLDLPSGKNNYGKFNALKRKKPSLKTMLAVGGWNVGSSKFSAMAANSGSRRRFIDSAVEMLKSHGFDGLDVDWEYPNRRDSVHGRDDIKNFTLLLKELSAEFSEYGLRLSAAVSADGDMASLSYNIPSICRYLDFVNLMAYDMHGAWNHTTGHNAPLFKSRGNHPTVDASLRYWIREGCPPEKLIMGVPFYGRTFKLSNDNSRGVGASVSGPGISGPYTCESGFIGYNELSKMMERGYWDLYFDDNAKVPYAVKGDDWISYDNAKSLTLKVNHALDFNIGGVMVWAMDTDDFNGSYHSESYPLLRALNRAL